MEFFKKTIRVTLTSDNLIIILVLRTPATSTCTKISVEAVGPLKGLGRFKPRPLIYRG